MTTFEQLDEALAARGWRYDVSDEQFFDCTRALEWEDTVGNNLERPFEVDVFERVDDRGGPQFLRIPFDIAAAKNAPAKNAP